VLPDSRNAVQEAVETSPKANAAAIPNARLIRRSVAATWAVHMLLRNAVKAADRARHLSYACYTKVNAAVAQIFPAQCT
jgi:uncharacterized membrane protein